MSKLNKRVLRMLVQSKGQNIAVALVIGIGLMFYIAMSSAIVNLDTTVNAYYNMTNAADLYVDIPKINSSEIKNLEGLAGVEYAEGRIVKDVRFIGDENEKVTLRMISIPSTKKAINALYHHDASSNLSGNNEAFLFRSFSEARNIGKGESLKIQTQGQNYQFDIKGIVSSSEFIYLMESDQSLLPDFKNFGVLYVTEEFALKSLNTAGTYNQVLVKIKPNYSGEAVKKAIEKRLESKGVQRVFLRKDQLSSRMVQEEINGNKKTTTVVPIFFLGIAATIMYVMVSRMVKNDKMTIGILKAMGFDNKKIIGHYCLYAVGIGIFGAIIGVVCGSLVSVYVTILYSTETFNIPILKTIFNPWTFVSALLLSVGFSVAAGGIGAYGVVQIDPAVAMRPEEPKSGKRIWLEQTFLWKHISFTEKMVIRNVLRNKLRMLMLSVGIAMTYVVIIMPVFFVDAFVDMFEFQYGQMQKMDYNVVFTKFVDESIVKNLKEYPSVKSTEGKIEFPFEAANGHYVKTINVIGLKKDTQMIAFYDAQTKQPLKGGVDGLIINDGLAKLLHVKVGDELTLRPFIPDKDSHHYKVGKIVIQNLGANIYMPLEILQKDYFDPSAVNGVYVKGGNDLKQVLSKGKNIATLLSVSDMKNAYKEFMDLTNTSIGMMMFFGVILGVAIVYNTVVLMMNERSIEIASMRVLGVTHNEIFSIFVREIFIMSVLGIIMGIPLGKYSLQAMSGLFTTELYSFEANVLLSHYITAIVVTIFTIVLSLFLSYEKILKSNFIEALKSRVT
jgi:putative ABC transport system permease protein